MWYRKYSIKMQNLMDRMTHWLQNYTKNLILWEKYFYGYLYSCRVEYPRMAHMGHRTKRIGWWRVEKWVKMVVYKELWGLWRLRLHKTKRLHWFNFGLHRGAFRLHEAGERFTHIGLHVYACGLFRCCAWKTLYTRVFKAFRGFICAQVWTERVRY